MIWLLLGWRLSARSVWLIRRLGLHSSRALRSMVPSAMRKWTAKLRGTASTRIGKRPVLSEQAAHILHYVAWVLGALDVIIVGLCLFFVQKGH